MVRALWFILRTALLVAGAVWVADRPGSVDVHWLGYDVRTKVGYALLGLVLLFAFALFLYRGLWLVIGLPRRWRRHQALVKRQKGFRALTLGLTAVAAGDAKMADYHGGRARRMLPDDKGLTVLLEAQAARLKKDDAGAQTHFERLMRNDDTAFLGLRGLLLSAVERDDVQEAARLSTEALRLHPDQPWVLRTAYDLDLRLGRWDDAQRHLKLALHHGAIEEDRAASDRSALLLQEASDYQARGDENAALGRLKLAHRINPAFVPAAILLARAQLAKDNAKGAAEAIEKTWREQPHPDLVPLWHEAMPAKLAKDGAGRMSWYERLVALRPDSAESQIAASEAAIENGLWGAARAYLERAEAIRPGRRILKLRARLAQSLDRPEESVLMLRRASEAPPEKAWFDRVTGQIHDHWSPVAPPHNGFNTIIWDYPVAQNTDGAAGDRSELLITAPARTGTS